MPKEFEKYPDINVLVFQAVNSGYATYHELETVYSYQDMIRFVRIYSLKNELENKAYEEAKQ